MATGCPNKERNNEFCTCSYGGCANHALCCECIQSHLKNKQLPGCCFPAEAERTYDRSFQAFAKAWNL